MRYFNTAGPVRKDIHYLINPLERFNLDDILHLIRQEKYFVLHAPRQTGKTSAMLALGEYLNSGGEFYGLYVNIESAQTARNDILEGMRTIISDVSNCAFQQLDTKILLEERPRILQIEGANSILKTALNVLSTHLDRPLVLFLDEIDSLVGETLISVLRQLRAGYASRPNNFPISVILCGVRDIRDYRIHTKEKEIITGGSAFNIKAKSLRLGNFHQSEIETLLIQHTERTGQKFEDGIFDDIWELTKGQPWLVNALAYEVTYEIKENRDRSIPITRDMIFTAKENLILRRETHLDQLVDKLQEERVRSVIQPILLGDSVDDFNPSDVEYIVDLGLITRQRNGTLQIANEIYKEVIPRELSFGAQMAITQQTAWYVNEQNKLNMDKLLTAFQEFFRENSESWRQVYEYHEAGPQLLLQAFLQRVVNSGGHIHREYALGRKRTDLLVNYNGEKFVIEIKLLRKNLEKQIEEGIIQTKDYADKCSAESAFLLIFDRRENISWDEKVYIKERRHDSRKITVYGM